MRQHITVERAQEVLRGHIATEGEVSLYLLVDPRDNTVHYAGQRETDMLEDRLDKHITQRGKNPAKEAWIDELLGLDLRPSMVVVGACSSDEREEQERRLVDRIRQFGHLHNVSSSGSWGDDTRTTRQLAFEVTKDISIANSVARGYVMPDLYEGTLLQVQLDDRAVHFHFQLDGHDIKRTTILLHHPNPTYHARNWQRIRDNVSAILKLDVPIEELMSALTRLASLGQINKRCRFRGHCTTTFARGDKRPVCDIIERI